MKYKDFESLILNLRDSSFIPFSEKIAKLTVKNYCDLKESGMSLEEAILSTISAAASTAYRESIVQALFIALHVEPDKPLSRDELKSLLRVIHPGDD